MLEDFKKLLSFLIASRRSLFLVITIRVLLGKQALGRSAARLRRDFPQLGIRVEIPEVTGFDWNDVWMRRREGSRKPKKK